MNSGLSQNLISDSEQLTQIWRGRGRGHNIPVSLFDLFLRTPQNTQSREPRSRVFEQHEGLVATQKVGV